MEYPVICIDGPSASGKGTIAKMMAEALGFNYLDSGSLYRLVALKAREENVLDDVQAIADLVPELNVRFENNQIFLDGRDVTQEIRKEQCSMDASFVSSLPQVRAALLDWQRDFVKAPGLVADGRDMGTRIFPQAELKVFLNASAELRAERRYKQLQEMGETPDMKSILANIQLRDRQDRERSCAPAVPAADAFILDTSNRSAASCSELILSWWDKIRQKQTNKLSTSSLQESPTSSPKGFKPLG